MEFCNTVFIVTESYSCPLYNVGEEFVVRNFTMSIKRDKQICLLLLHEFMKLLAAPESVVCPTSPFPLMVIPTPGTRRIKFQCSGCIGLIRFEHKKNKTQPTTVQGWLIEEAKQQRNELERNRIYSLLRGVKLFNPLDAGILKHLALLMQLKQCSENKILIEEGMPGTRFYVLLEGQAAVEDKNGELFAKLKRGDVFGETSLLTGELAYPSVRSITPVQLLVLNSQNFRQVTSTYPHLNRFFFNIAMTRIRKNEDRRFFIRSDQVNSGMSGELACISPVDLFQLINVGSKSGKVELTLPEGQACVLFNEGEIVHAAYGQLQGKEALFALLTKEKGTFIYRSHLSEEYKKKQKLGGFMGLMMEGVQQFDEGKSTCAV